MNNNKIRTFFILFFSVFFIAFSIFSFVQDVSATDDNANDSSCAAWISNCDTSFYSDACTNHGFNYTPYGYPGSAGNPNCCGDDSNEYFINACINNFSSDVGETAVCNSTNACADDNNDCVNNNHDLYNYGDYANSGIDLSPDKEKCEGTNCHHTIGGTVCDNYNVWRDQDTDSSVCSYTWTNKPCQPADRWGNSDNDNCDDYDGNSGDNTYNGNKYLSTPQNSNLYYCCGDDSNEYYKTRDIDPNCSGNNCPSFSSDSNDGACCINQNYCVYNGTCYNYTDKLSQNDSYEFCATIDNIDTQAGKWYDPDTLKSAGGEDTTMCEYLGFNITKAGEDNVGEYPDTSTYECCGDDANEVYNTSRQDSDIAWSDSTSACCSQSSCIRNGSCYTNDVSGLNSNGDDNVALCGTEKVGDDYLPTWKDIDDNLSDYILAASTNICGGTLSDPGLYAGESNVGEYTDTTTKECCGDDANEYIISDYCPGYSGPNKCCNNSNDKIDADGNCVSSCPSTNNAPYTPSNPSPANNATCVSTSPTLSWDGGDPDGDSVTYNIYFCKGDNCSLTFLTSVTATSYSLSNLDNSSIYRWQIISDDGTDQTSGDVWSFTTKPATPRSSLSSALEAYNDVNFDNCPLSSPYPIKIFWSDYKNESRDGFKIYRNTSASKPSSPIASINPSADSTSNNGGVYYYNYHYRDTEINSNNVSYHYWVTAYKGSCESDSYQLHMQSNNNADAALYSVFSTPTNFRTTSVLTNTINVAWDSHPLGSVGTFYLVVTPDGTTNCSNDPISTNNTSYSITQDCNGDNISENTTYNIGLLYARNYLINEQSCGTTLTVTTPSSDSTGPSISFNPTSRSWDNTNADVTVTASDSSGISSTKYCWTTSNSCTPSNSFTNGSTLSQSSNGNWNLCVEAVDNHNNSTINCSGRYQVDKTAPVVSNATAHCDSYTDSCETDDDTTIYFTWDVSDSGGSGLAQCWAELNDSTPDEAAGTDGQDTDVGQSGQNTYYVQCKDNAGNYSNTDSDTITIQLPSCNSNSDCNDGNSCTQDVCTNPGQSNSSCTNTPYCSGDDTSCGCTSCQNCNSDDGWYNTGETRWVDDTSCTEKEQEKWEYRDYYCSDTSCDYSVTGTNWQDTGDTRNKADNTSCDGSCHICCSGSCTDTTSGQKCCSDSDCDDNNSNTTDVCHNPNTCNSYCTHTQGTFPDLIIDDISWNPSIPSAGNNVSFTVKVKNQGNDSAGNSVVKYYIDGNYLSYDNVSSISAGGTATETFNWSASCGHSHDIKAVADANNNVLESNESNNERTETITVNNCLPNEPSVSGPTSGNTNESLSFTAQATDPDGDNIRYNFDWGDNTSYTTGYVSSGSAQTANHSWSNNGDYNVCVRAMDSDGWSSPNCRVVSIGNGNQNQAPIADFEFCKENGTQRTVRFTNKSSDPDGSVTAWSWNFGDGDSCLPDCNESGFSGTNQNPVHTFGTGSGGNLEDKYSYDFNSDLDIYRTWSLIDLKSHPPITLQTEFGEVHSPFRVSYDYNASGRHYVWAPNNSGRNGYDDFRFYTASSGNYIIWGRTIAPNGHDDSFYISIDGGNYITWGVKHSTYWTWDQVNQMGGADPYVFHLSKGTHTIRIKEREDGTKVDVLYVTKQGEGHPNSVSPQWYTTSNKALEEKSDSGQSFLLAPYNSNSNNYEVGVDVRTIGDADDGVSIIFGYQDDKNFYELNWDNPDGYYDQRWQPTALKIYRYQNGTKHQLAFKNVYSDRLHRNQWKRLSVYVHPNKIEGKINGITKISTNADPTLGKAGLASYDNDGGVQFDNFKIKEAEGGNQFNVSLTVTDNGGSTGNTQKTVNLSSLSNCPSNYSPTATNLSVNKGDYCSNPSHFFSWNYNDADGDNESKFQIQVDDNSDFSSPKVDKTFDNLSYPSGTKNSQVILVSDSSEYNKLDYNKLYYWRVRVYDSKGGSSGWVNGPNFRTEKHKYPVVDFSWQPNAPTVGETVNFRDNSQVFNSHKQNWLWNFQDGTPSGSTSQNPSAVFNSQGGKKVDLTVVDSDNYYCQLEKLVPVGSSLPKWKEIAP